MKKIYLFISICSAAAFSYGQGFINGSFESTTSVGCDYNNNIPAFNSKMDNVVMFEGTETDIHESGCYIPSVPDGVKAVGLANSDALNIELTEPLVEGENYNLTFSMFGNTSFGPLGTLEFGATDDELVMGAFLGTADVIFADTWEEKTLTFTAPNNSTHISVRNTDEGVWHQIDAFSIEMACTPIEIEASETALCFDEELVLTATAGGEVTWEGDIENGVEFIPESTGVITYTVTSDSDDDCPNSIEIEVYELPEVIATVDKEAICFGDSILLAGDGTATTYEWDPDSVIDSVMYLPEEVGEITFTVTGTDDNSCENEDEITVTVNALPTVVATVDDNEICLGESVVFTGEGALTYVWDEPVMDGVTFEPTETNVYNLLGVDANGCENMDSIEVVVYPDLEITYETTDELFGSDGEIDITVTGGNPAYIYDWDIDGTGDFDDDEDLTGLVAGTYIVAVEDAAGCTATQTIILDGQVGVEEEQIQLAIYPNPTVDLLNIVVNGNFEYSVYTLDGGELLTGVGIDQKQISMQEFAAGVYYISVTAEGYNTVVKVVKA